MDYPWPGNVRELSHVIERAVLWSRNHTLTVDDLSLAFRSTPPAVLMERAWSRRRKPLLLPPSRPAATCTQWERSLIERAMRESGGNQTKAAQRLGITRRYSPIPAQEIWSSGWVISPNLAISPPPKPLRIPDSIPTEPSFVLIRVLSEASSLTGPSGTTNALLACRRVSRRPGWVR